MRLLDVLAFKYVIRAPGIVPEVRAASHTMRDPASTSLSGGNCLKVFARSSNKNPIVQTETGIRAWYMQPTEAPVGGG
jgi:hypothetical protein